MFFTYHLGPISLNVPSFLGGLYFNITKSLAITMQIHFRLLLSRREEFAPTDLKQIFSFNTCPAETGFIFFCNNVDLDMLAFDEEI